MQGIFLIVIGDGAAGSGVVEEITDLSSYSIQSDGLFLIAEQTFGTGTLSGTVDLIEDLNLENSDNLTVMLVTGLNPAINVGSGFGGSDLDVDDDGVIEATGDYDGDTVDDGAPWTSIVDCVGLVETVGSGDLIYCDTTVGPDGTFVPGHAYLCPGGWVIGLFDPADPTAVDTPDLDNNCTVPVNQTTWSKAKSLYR
jgi:hypothetical protein